jgi:hypothetical protein
LACSTKETQKELISAFGVFTLADGNAFDRSLQQSLSANNEKLTSQEK